jgi:hypothetical protein
MPAIIIKNPNPNQLDEFVMLEIQGDLELRGDKMTSDGRFIGELWIVLFSSLFKKKLMSFAGDLLYNKYGNPVSNWRVFFQAFSLNDTHHAIQILIVGSHVLFGKEKALENGFAVIKKVSKADGSEDEKRFDETIINESTPNASVSILESTVNVENRTKPQIEYQVQAVIRKKLIFQQRPRPIISNLPKSN